MLSIKDFAQEVATKVGGTVSEVEKANGIVKTAVQVPTENEKVSANIYIDGMYDDGLTVDEAVEKIRHLMEKEARKDRNINVDFMQDFEQVKPMLRARLYNEITKADVSRSASKYGLDDLIITAAIELPQAIDGMTSSIRVKKAHVDMWGVTVDEVLDIAEQNSREHATLEDMVDIMKSMGQPVFDDMRGQMIVISNDTRAHGAYSIIAKLDELREMFPDGFTILPSSVHEVIAVPLTDDSLDGMVQDVNETQVNPEEQLSNHAYRIAA